VPSKPVKKAKRSYDSQETRRRILSVASEQFQSRGYHATSMHDIMHEASVPGGSMYHYFPTKKSLGLAVIRESVAESIQETWIEPMRSAKTASDGVQAIFGAVATQIERDNDGVTGCPLNNLTMELSLADPEFQSSLRTIFDAWTDAVEDCIKQDIAAKTLPKINARETATAVVAGFSGAMALAKAQQIAAPIRACARLMKVLFER
jgi:AcrR family transcriptional regulator